MDSGARRDRGSAGMTNPNNRMGTTLMAERVVYRTIAYGEWTRPRMRNFREQCCDCGLIHRLDFPRRRRPHRIPHPPRQPRHRRRAAEV